jgi:hypothetical protein
MHAKTMARSVLKDVFISPKQTQAEPHKRHNSCCGPQTNDVPLNPKDVPLNPKPQTKDVPTNLQSHAHIIILQLRTAY